MTKTIKLLILEALKNNKEEFLNQAEKLFEDISGKYTLKNYDVEVLLTEKQTTESEEVSIQFNKLSQDDELLIIISDFFETSINSINLDTSLVLELNADSLDMVELAMELEEHYDIDIYGEEAQDLDTPRKIKNYILKQVQTR